MAEAAGPALAYEVSNLEVLLRLFFLRAISHLGMRQAVQAHIGTGRVKYSCLDVSARYLLLGANTGSVYIFDRGRAQSVRTASLLTVSSHAGIHQLILARRHPGQHRLREGES
jgi:hypothetical protein